MTVAVSTALRLFVQIHRKRSMGFGRAALVGRERSTTIRADRAGGAATTRWAASRWRDLYYGWWLVVALGVTATVSFGVLQYAIGVFVTPMERDLGWTRAEISGAYSFATLVAGFAAIPVGRWLDRHG